jgi:hypothetical protein
MNVGFCGLSALVSSAFVLPLTHVFLSAGGRSWRVRPRRGTTLSIGWTPSLAGTGSSTTPFDALVEALRTPDGWLVYRAEALRDQLPKLDAQAAEDVSAAETVKTALVDRDEALHKAQEDLAGARTMAAEWEAEVASVRSQLQQDRATLEGARAWQSQAEEKAKEAEELRTSLVDRAASLASTEEQLRQERVVRQQAEAQL